MVFSEYFDGVRCCACASRQAIVVSAFNGGKSLCYDGHEFLVWLIELGFVCGIATATVRPRLNNVVIEAVIMRCLFVKRLPSNLT